MSGISDKEWDEFLNADDESESPFAGDNSAPVDPLIFVESDEAPELRATNIFRPRADDTAPQPAQPAPYFVEDASDNSRKQWVPSGNAPDGSESEIIENTSTVVQGILRALLFLAPLTVIAVSFFIALSIE